MLCEIIAYTEQDTEACLPLMFDLGYPTTKEQLTKRLRRIHEQPNSYTYVLKENKEVKGMIGFRMFYYYEADEPAGQITLLVIRKDMQNKGYGSRLLQFTEQLMISNGVRHITLNSGIKKEREYAHNFYIKHGFIKTGYRFTKNLSE